MEEGRKPRSPKESPAKDEELKIIILVSKSIISKIELWVDWLTPILFFKKVCKGRSLENILVSIFRLIKHGKGKMYWYEVSETHAIKSWQGFGLFNPSSKLTKQRRLKWDQHSTVATFL